MCCQVTLAQRVLILYRCCIPDAYTYIYVTNIGYTQTHNKQLFHLNVFMCTVCVNMNMCILNCTILYSYNVHNPTVNKGLSLKC